MYLRGLLKKLPLIPQRRKNPQRRKGNIDEQYFALLRAFCGLAV
jgi:hypothetical protein